MFKSKYSSISEIIESSFAIENSDKFLTGQDLAIESKYFGIDSP